MIRYGADLYVLPCCNSYVAFDINALIWNLWRTVIPAISCAVIRFGAAWRPYPSFPRSGAIRARAGSPLRQPGENSLARETGRKPRYMTARSRRPCWDSVQRVVRLLVSVINALAQLLDAVRRIR